MFSLLEFLIMKKTIFITGTSSGIGRITAIYFAEKGWNVAATMRHPKNEEELIKTKEELIKTKEELTSYK